MREDRFAHLRVPELHEMIGNAGDRLLVALMGEEPADLVGHVDQLVRRHARPRQSRCAGVREHLEAVIAGDRDQRDAPASATRSASAVGADTATTIGAPITAAFCTISTDTGLVRRTTPRVAGTAARRQRAGEFVERIVAPDVLAQGNQAGSRLPISCGMDRTRLPVDGLTGRQQAIAPAIASADIRDSSRPGAADASPRRGFRQAARWRRRSWNTSPCSGPSHIRSSMPCSPATISSSSISSGDTTMPSDRLKPTAKSSRSAGVAIITACAVR